MESYTEHAANFAKNNSLYMISYISSEDNHEENFYSGMFVYPIGGVRK